MNRVEDILQRQAEISRLMGATIAYSLDQDIGIAAHTGSIGVENNFMGSGVARVLLSLASKGLLAYTAYDTYETYQEEGAQAAAEQLAWDYFIGRATLMTLKGVGKVVPWDTLGRGWSHLVEHTPTLERTLEYLGRGYESLSHTGEIVTRYFHRHGGPRVHLAGAGPVSSSSARDFTRHLGWERTTTAEVGSVSRELAHTSSVPEKVLLYDARQALPKEQSWTVRAGQEWKLKVFGKAQRTGTEGHSFRSYREAIRAAKREDVERVLLNRGMKKATYLPLKPNRRPDVTIVRRNGMVDQIEVPSWTDRIEAL